MSTAELIGGNWRACAGDLGFDLEDPFTGQTRQRALGTTADGIGEAISHAAASRWGRRAASERADALDRVASAVELIAPSIVEAEATATGVPLRQTSMLAVILSGAFRLAAAQLREGWLSTTINREDGRAVHVDRLPWGPAACLVPWNAPAPMAAHKVASALAAGCPTIVKPSELAPMGTQLLAEAIASALDGDRGAFQLIHGDSRAGSRLVSDPRIRAVSFTGGLAGGRSVAAACAFDIKPVQLELGGNNPLIVLPGTDPAVAGRAVADLLTTLNGQWCRALGRLIVPHADHDEIMSAALSELAKLTSGAPLDLATDYGPLVHSRHKATVESARDLLGGVVHTSTPVPTTGNFVAPALVTGADPAKSTEEIFGPIATVHPFATVEEAIVLANATPYGLEGYVYGPDESAAMAVARQLACGEVKVNGSSIMSLHLFTPRPAWGLSGTGEEGTAETLRFFTNPRVTGVEGAFALHRPS